MGADRWRRVRRWARRRRKALLIGGAAVLAIALAAWLIYDAVTEPVVGQDDGAGSSPFAAPSGTPSLPPPGTDLGTLDPTSFGLPTGGFSAGCDNETFTMGFTSDAPIAVAGYLTSGGEMDYYPNESTGSVSVVQCSTNPSVLVIAQAGPRASTITCTTTRSGRVVETRTAPGANGIVYCYG